MRILNTIAEMRAWRAERHGSVGFVPTMGAFHEGHLSLMRRVRHECEAATVSLFVNPTQFGPNEDLSRYPHTFESDCAAAAEIGVDAMFAPEAAEMYPEGWQTRVVPGELADGLCGPFRPGHFTGVASIVCKLLNIVSPTHAYFGEKDFQQLRIIEQMVLDLDMAVQIVRCPTVRELDGLAMSSRNAYLSPEEREQARSIHRAIVAAQKVVFDSASSARLSARVTEQGVHDIIAAQPLCREVQYAHVVDPVTLKRIRKHDRPARIAVAAVFGNTRLIDNGPLIPGSRRLSPAHAEHRAR